MAESKTDVRPALSVEELPRSTRSSRPRRRARSSAGPSNASATRLVLAASFEDCVLIDLAAKVDPGHRGGLPRHRAHFPETLAFVEEVRARYDLNLTVTKPGPEAGGLALRHASSAASSARSRPLQPGPAGQARPG